MPFSFTKTRIPDVVIVEPRILGDSRGFFAELYKTSDFKQAGLKSSFVQVNQSRSQKNVLRGLHYQLNPRAQAKLVGVLRGEIFDVAVDLRQGSSTFGQWVGACLSETNKKMLYIPEGFAHGFCALCEGTEVLYHCSCEYSPDHDRSVLWNDPAIGIDWPVAAPVLSAKDAAARILAEADNNFIYTVS